MGYFNLNSILYNLRKICKYLSFSLLIVAFVVIALLLMGKNVDAAIGYPENTGLPVLNDEVYNKCVEFYENSEYDSFFVTIDGGVFYLCLFDNIEGNVFHTNTTGVSSNNIYWLMCTDQDDIPLMLYRVNSNTGDISFFSDGVKFGSGSGRTRINGIYGGNMSVYYLNSAGYPDSLNPMFVNSYENFEKPYISHPHDNTDDYISGEFTSFLVVGGHDVDYLTFFYSDFSVEFSESSTVDLVLDENSPYYLNNYENNNIYIIPKTVIPYLDGHEYAIQLHYLYNDVSYHDELITWTTNFSEQAILNDDINRQDQINQGLQDLNKSQQEMNNFLNDDSYDSDNITDNMPNSNEYVSPTDSGFDSIFNGLYNAFTSSNTQTVRFVVPFSNGQYIDIPSDLVTSRLPQVIITLIQSVYWFVICRYIVKDIARTVEKAKSGEILDGSTDDNIKTDLL